MLSEIYALHGFLGSAGDWDLVLKGFQNTKTYAENIVNGPTEGSMEKWASWFNKKLEKKKNRRILLGYSLGGRLGLHVLHHSPNLWDCAIFVSSHPGLKNDSERRDRLVEDKMWAERFQKDDWNRVISDWNKRQIFDSQNCVFERREEEHDRNKLFQILENWSLGHQIDFRPWLKGINIPIIWIYGNDDLKFREIAKEITLKHPKSQKIGIDGAMHRVPWEQPTKFIEEIRNQLYQP